MTTFAEICSCFQRAGRPIAELGSAGQGGCIAVIADGARVAALSFTAEEESVLFANPGLDRIAEEGISPVDLPGGPGGDRIRFAPEYAYAWIGEERDLKAFSNYRVQEHEDPGAYRLSADADGRTVRLASVTSLVDRRDGELVRFSVERTVATAPSPIPDLPDGVRYAGYESHSTVSMVAESGGRPGGQCVGLWHLLQVPAGSILVLPLRSPAPPVRYFNTGGWRLHDRSSSPYLSWRYEGTANAKIGYGCAQVTGRVGALRRRNAGDWVLLVLEFPIFREMYYSDAVSPETAGDQVFQAWDGFGFGELEYHGPAVGRPPLPARWEDQARVWAFGGPPEQVRPLTRQLLSVEPEHIFVGGKP